MDYKEFIEQFQDFLAPKLDTYEQALYLYIFRHSRLRGELEVVIGFKSARARMACGVGEKGKPMSETTAYEKLQSLKVKGCIDIVSSERSGKRFRLRLPSEIPGTIPEPSEALAAPDIEVVDFFSTPENRVLILERDEHRCFYCMRAVTADNYVLEHVISRPEGNNGYRNLVAACRECNNRKNDSDAEDFLRTLYREEFLSAAEMKNRLEQLTKLKEGQLKPMRPTNGCSLAALGPVES